MVWQLRFRAICLANLTFPACCSIFPQHRCWYFAYRPFCFTASSLRPLALLSQPFCVVSHCIPMLCCSNWFAARLTKLSQYQHALAWQTKSTVWQHCLSSWFPPTLGSGSNNKQWTWEWPLAKAVVIYWKTIVSVLHYGFLSLVNINRSQEGG